MEFWPGKIPGLPAGGGESYANADTISEVEREGESPAKSQSLSLERESSEFFEVPKLMRGEGVELGIFPRPKASIEGEELRIFPSPKVYMGGEWL